MIRLTLLTVIMMGEIAVTLTVTLITVQSAYATIKTIVLLGLLPLLLETVLVMMRLTMLSAIMMAEIAVSTSTLITVLIVNVIFMKIVLLDLLPMWLATVFVMMRLTISTAIMMEETVADTMSTSIFVLIVDAISMRLALLVVIP